jgi:hypothetical protein
MIPHYDRKDKIPRFAAEVGFTRRLRIKTLVESALKIITVAVAVSPDGNVALCRSRRPARGIVLKVPDDSLLPDQRRQLQPSTGTDPW